ncbi:MAG TPA: hypothetical protein DDY98_09370 [Ruminococcaceae bacterium]|nr:hypothetical protein [Oscillospiraceae bacterium]
MAKCPKCGHRLRIIDVSQNCPKCGVNMRFYNFEENFYREAKYAELSQAGLSAKLRRLKASFIGSKLTILRLAVMLLPLVSLLLPSGKFVMSLVFKQTETPFSALGLYTLFSSGGLNFILGMKDAAVSGTAFSSLLLALAAYALTAVSAVLVLLTSILGFLSVNNMQKITCALSALGAAEAVASLILIARFSSVGENPILSGEKGFGLILTLVLFGVVFAVNLLLCLKGIPVVYDEGMLERIAVFKKVKSGEVNLDDLPQPVVETAETRKIDEEIAAEEAAFREKYAKEEA